MTYNYTERNISGIYQIKNLINNKLYIGSSKNLYERFLTHRAELRNNYHFNTHLQNAFNKYGEQNFQFTILQQCDNDQNLLFDLEQWYVDILNPEYNQNKEVVFLPMITLEARKKVSETRKKLYRENKLNVYKNKIYLYYKDGSFVGEFESGREAAKFIHTTEDKISSVAHGKWVQIKGYKAFFKKQESVEPFEKPKVQAGRIYKYYDVIDENGFSIYSGCAKDVSQYLNITIDSLRHYVKPKRPVKANGKYTIKSRIIK